MKPPRKSTSRLLCLLVILSTLLSFSFSHPALADFLSRTVPAPSDAHAASMQWLQEVELNGIADQASFGAAMSISADGNTIVIGAPSETVNGQTKQGAAYVYQHSETGWSEVRLLGSSSDANDYFGHAVAISGNGNYILVGAHLASIGPNHQGAAYMFTRSGALWTETKEFLGSSADEYFGESVALNYEGTRAILGVTGKNSMQGQVAVIERSGANPNWFFANPITASDGETWDIFGGAVALSADGNSALIGAPGKWLNRGVAYVMTHTPAGTWTQQGELLAWDGVSGDDFGNTVAFSGNGTLALIGADNASVGVHPVQGAAYTFNLSASTWVDGVKITASDGGDYDWFGSSLALTSDGSVALIGASHATVFGRTSQGAAYSFSGTDFSHEEKFAANRGAVGDYFGGAVALDATGNTVAVGAYMDTTYAVEAGSVFLYHERPLTWTHQQTLMAANGLPSDGFGRRLAVSDDGNTALVATASTESVYVFVRENDLWVFQTQILAPDAEALSFGASVALSDDGNTALIGASETSVNGYPGVGAAYLLTRTGTTWSAPVQLTAPDGEAFNRLGQAVGLSGDGLTAVLGASANNQLMGAVYVSTYTDGQWGAPVKVVADDGESGDQFGLVLSLDGDGSTLLVGAPTASNGTVNTGAMYTFVRFENTFVQESKFIPANVMENEWFGLSVALDRAGSSALIGTGSNNGQCYYYVHVGNAWSLEAEIRAPDGAYGAFCSHVDLSADGQTAIVGDFQASVAGNTEIGAGYVFVREASAWVSQGKLFAPDGLEDDRLGSRVAISGDGRMVVLSAPNKNFERGGIYTFVTDALPQFQVYMPVILK